MSLKVTLMNDFKTSMKEKDVIKKKVVSLIRGNIKQVEIDNRVELGDEQILEIIAKQVKQTRDAIEEFKKGERDDLVEESKLELEVLLSYLPKQLTEAEISEIVKETIAEVGAESMKDLGKVMPKVMGKTKGKADGKIVSQIVKQQLS